MYTLSQFNFLLVQNIPSDTAWVGLGIKEKEKYPYADNLMDKLYLKSGISNKIFTIHSNSTWMRISMGGFSPSILADITSNAKFSENMIKWQDLTEPIWSLKYSSLFLEDQLIESKPMVSYIDLNYPNIRVPREHFKRIIRYILKKNDCTEN